MTERRHFCPRNHDTFEVGRDSSYRCLQCKRDDGATARRARLAAEAAVREERRRLQEEAARERRRQEEAAERRREQEYQRALAAGGDVARHARWEREWERSPGLCQWQDLGPDGQYRPCMCMRRAEGFGVYCARHSRELDLRSVSA
jgi:hypothetical protein